MHTANVDYKLRVFISSKCGGRYTQIRKNLKEWFDGTGLIETYVYEEEPASSMNNVDAYMSYLDASEVCVFLIDNKDGVSDAVMREHQRAQSLSLRKYYVFCNETEKDPTDLQNEVRARESEKYKTVDCFENMDDVAYRSVMQDLIAIYRRRNIISSEETMLEKSKAVDSAPIAFAYQLNKNIILDSTKLSQVISHSLGIGTTEQPLSEVETHCAGLFRFLLGMQAFDQSAFEQLQNHITELHHEKMRDFFSKRFQAIKRYYSNELDACIVSLREALQMAIAIDEIPNWLAMDVAIDLRNSLNKKDRLMNRYRIDNEGQDFIQASAEPLFYPLLDRRVSEFREKIDLHRLKIINSSPYSVHIGGDIGISPLADIFVISVMHASLTQLQLVRSHIITLLTVLCDLYADRDLWKLLVQLLVLDRRQKDVELLLGKFNNYARYLLSSEDISTIWKAITMQPYPQMQMASKFILLQTFGDYMSDVEFLLRSNELIGYSIDWLEDENCYIANEKWVFDFYKENIHRINSEYLIQFVEVVFRKKLRRFYDKAAELITVIYKATLSDDLQQRIQSMLCTLLNDQAEYKDVHRLEDAIIFFAISATIDISQLEHAVSEKKPDFYAKRYSLELLAKNESDYVEHIQRYLDKIHACNQTQGVHGHYFGNSENHFRTLENLVCNSECAFDSSVIDKLVDAFIETIAAKEQLLSEKLSATEFMISLYRCYHKTYDFDKVLPTIESYLSSIDGDAGMPTFDNTTISMVVYAMELLREQIRSVNSSKIIETLYSIDGDDKLEIIRAFEGTCRFLRPEESLQVSSELLYAFLHYAILRCSHIEKDIRFMASKCLIALTHYPKTQKMALRQLSHLLDHGDHVTKMAIVSRIKQIQDANYEELHYMLRKASVDANYRVRMLAEREKQKLISDGVIIEQND